MVDRQTKCVRTVGINLNPQKTQKNKRKTQAKENNFQQRLGAKLRFLRFIQPAVYPHEGNQSDYLF